MQEISKRLPDPKVQVAKYRKRKAASDPPLDAQIRTAFFGKPLQQLPDVNPRLFAVLALIESGYKTSDALVESLQDQLHRTTVFTLLAAATGEGLARFRPIITEKGTKREFVVTPKGRKCLTALAIFLNEYSKASKK